MTRVRVLIVEDSPVVRRLLSHIVSSDARLEVAGEAASAEEALRLLPSLRPDVISMDVRLPGMDGLEATRRIMSDWPTPIVVIADAVPETTREVSLNALRSGALSIVEKPRGLGSQEYQALAETICTQLAIMSAVPVIRRRGSLAGSARSGARLPPMRALESRPAARRSGRGAAPRVLGIAASTGGPPALSRVLGALPSGFALPVLLVQHMGAAFMEGFAQWLDGLVPLTVGLARDGERLRAGQVYVAPGERHLRLAASGDGGYVARLGCDAAIGNQRPAANALFGAMAEVAGPAGLGVLLTGMGEDGAAGLAALHEAGGMTIAEDESTAVVFGMPGAAIRRGAAEQVLPLDEIGPHLAQLVPADPGRQAAGEARP